MKTKRGSFELERDKLIKKQVKALNQLVETLSKVGGEYPGLWEIIVALRGPDSLNSWYEGAGLVELKELTTGRIRGFLGLSALSRWIHCREKPLSPALLKRRDEILHSGGVPEHFVAHYGAAVAAIKILFGYDLETEQEVTTDQQVLQRERQR